MTRRFDSWSFFWILFYLLLVSALLSGCATVNTRSASLTPVCKALIGPIHYNSKLKTSSRYAGPALAPDLAQRNQVGINLACPAYR